MFKYSFFVTCIFFLAVSCQKATSVHSVEKDDLQISINTACGWCAPGDSMAISKTATVYKYYPSSCSKEGKIQNNATPPLDWEELIAALDLEKFNAINLNECNLCADGCDEWITVQQGKFNHTIRYGSTGNHKLKEVLPFIEKLHAIRTKMKAQVIK